LYDLLLLSCRGDLSAISFKVVIKTLFFLRRVFCALGIDNALNEAFLYYLFGLPRESLSNEEPATFFEFS
jgi:hypothetical protein